MHQHSTRGSASLFWFVHMGRAVSRGTQPTAWPYRHRRILDETEDISVSGPGPYRLVLLRVDLERTGEAAGPLNTSGPAAVAVVDGQVSITGTGAQVLRPVLQREGDSLYFVNRGALEARLLAIQLLSASTP